MFDEHLSVCVFVIVRWRFFFWFYFHILIHLNKLKNKINSFALNERFFVYSRIFCIQKVYFKPFYGNICISPRFGRLSVEPSHSCDLYGSGEKDKSWSWSPVKKTSSNQEIVVSFGYVSLRPLWFSFLLEPNFCCEKCWSTIELERCDLKFNSWKLVFYTTNGDFQNSEMTIALTSQFHWC